MVNVKGCLMTKEWEQYVPIVASAHEMMRSAAMLCDEARELDKAADGVIRKPHKKDGVIVSKTKLIRNLNKGLYFLYFKKSSYF